jgi:hypothetical protein
MKVASLIQGLTISILAVASLPAFAEGKFCLVTNNLKNCYYYDANQCRAEAVRLGGMCVLNPEQQASSSVGDSMSYIQEQGEKGRQAGIAQRAARASSQTASEPTTSWDVIAEAEKARQGKKRVIYSCNGVQGFTPVVGCVVIGYANP